MAAKLHSDIERLRIRHSVQELTHQESVGLRKSPNAIEMSGKKTAINLHLESF
jgi:hypothetical protein